MLEKETVKIEDSLIAMVRIAKENEEIDRKMEIEKIKHQARKEVQQIEEVKNKEISELEKELAMLKEMYEIKQKEIVFFIETSSKQSKLTILHPQVADIQNL